MLQLGPHTDLRDCSLGCEPLVLSRQGWLYGHVTCAGAQNPCLERPCAVFNAVLSQSQNSY